MANITTLRNRVTKLEGEIFRGVRVVNVDGERVRLSSGDNIRLLMTWMRLKAKLGREPYIGDFKPEDQLKLRAFAKLGNKHHRGAISRLVSRIAIECA